MPVLDPPIEDPPLAINDNNPQPTSNTLTFGSGIGFDAVAEVYTRQKWGDAWTLQDKLVCTEVNWAASPTIPTAQLVYRYGHTLERNGTVGVRAKASLGGYYVRIIVVCADGNRRWHGFVDDVADAPSGYVARAALDEDDLPITVQDPTGVQTLSCVGMVAALDRSPILNSFFQTNSTNQQTGYSAMRAALSAPAFNPRTKLAEEPGELRQIENCSAAEAAVPVTQWEPTTEPDFPATLPAAARNAHLLVWKDLYGVSPTGVYWTSKKMVQYLVCYCGPRDGDSAERLPIWVYDPDNDIPDWDRPDLDCEGKTLKESLDLILSLKHSLGYWVWVDDVTNRIVVQAFTSLESTLTVGVDKDLNANSRWLDIVCDADPATSFTLQKTESAVANQVLVRGSKRVLIATLKVGTELVNGWTSTLATAFDTEFGSMLTSNDIRERYAARDALEQGRYKALWRNFIVASAFTWKDSATADLFRVDNPDPSAYYATNDRYLPYPANLRILPNLPLKANVNYLDATAITLHRNSTAQFREIEVYGLAHGANFSGTMAGDPTIWTNRAKRDVQHDINDPDYELYVKPLKADLGLGISLDVSGAFQGILGGNSGASHIPVLPPGSLEVTLAFEEDRYLEAVWPATIPTEVDGVLRKTFDFGEEYQQIEIAKNTIVGIAGRAFQRIADRTWVRNDYDRLLELAKQLQKWIAQSRSIVRLNSRRCTAKLWPGQLVKKLNPTKGHEATCNCVITEVAMSFPIGTAENPGKPTMRIVTNRGEMDPLFFQPRLS
jgi:hypothetical protein